MEVFEMKKCSKCATEINECFTSYYKALEEGREVVICNSCMSDFIIKSVIDENE